MSFRLRSVVASCLLILLLAASACGKQSGSSDTDGASLDPTVAGQADFDLDLALELGLLCLQSYQMLIDFEAGDDFELPSEYALIDVFLTPELYPGEGNAPLPIAYIATRGDAIYLVFRGTSSLQEWLEDAELFQTDYSIIPNSGQVEIGFIQIYVTINTAILNTINQLAQTGFFTKIYITGQSLGAALATLAVPDVIANTQFNAPILYNFASPRVGDPTFAESTINGSGNTRWRIANSNDLVPQLPPPEVLRVVNTNITTFTFEHIDESESLTFGKELELTEDFDEFTDPSEGIFGDIEINHAMCSYYNALCEMTDDVDTCQAAATGINNCNE